MTPNPTSNTQYSTRKHGYSTAVIGGGAAGLIAAISARRRGGSVVVCDRMPRIGKKILISGNGRCNLSNDDLSEIYYNTEARELVKAVFARFGKTDILKFFKELGVMIYSDKGRIFPVTNQASSVLSAIELELKSLGIVIEPGFDAVNVSRGGSGFMVASREGKKISCDNVIIAGGGRAYPALGSDGSAYKLALQFGHKVVEPVPSAVPVVVKDPLCHLLQGQKISAKVRGVIGGKISGEAAGELLFTKYGLSGTAILDISDDISVALNRRKDKDVNISADLVPFMSGPALEEELEKRIKKNIADEDLLIGTLPNKFGAALKGILKSRDPSLIATQLKDKRFKVLGTRGWNEAEFTAGGIRIDEVSRDTLGSKLVKGVYFAGEILDVNGRRGGYNLAWAWASGYVAGNTL